DCHRDHRGREASLVMLPDTDCTSCHRQLENHVKDKSASKTLNVSVFRPRSGSDANYGHPEFKLWRDPNPQDPAKPLFIHKMHMHAGTNPNYTLDKIKDLSERERSRQAGQKDTEAVQLDCASCHRLSGPDFNVTQRELGTLPLNLVETARAAGDYVL